MLGPEILVHAGAPSRGSDDARYRTQASGILSFESAKTHVVLPGPAHGKEAHRATQRSPIRTSQEGQHTLAQDSITSTDPAPRIHLTDAFTTWVTPVTARPTPTILIGRTPAPTYIGRTSTPASDVLVGRTPADQQRPRTVPSGPFSIQETPHLRPVVSHSFATPPSAIPNSQPSPSQQNGTPTFEQSSSPSPTHRPSPTAKRKRPDAEQDLEEWTQPEDTSTPPLLSQPQGAPSSSPAADDAALRSSSPSPPDSALPPSYRRRQIGAPPPKTSTNSFTTHVTPGLRYLQRGCARIIETVRPFRPIGVLERGHWRFVIPAGCDEAAREKMWTFLQDFIEGGRAGWAVWAVFEEGEDPHQAEKGDKTASTEEAGTAGVAEGRPTAGQVKVYCWGEVVAEMYAVLFLATNRQVNRWGARWIDAAGNVVVQMGMSS
ncbi:MAG: hypothetical protein Q9184_001679 [Pyrenodesmia sp. 2 TL-2023]